MFYMKFLFVSLMFLSCFELQAQEAVVAAESATGSSEAQGAPAAAPQRQPLRIVNRIAATVNGRPITSNEVSYALMPIAAQLNALYPRQGDEFNRQLTKAKAAILKDCIERELVLFEFESKGHMMPDSYVDQEVNRVIQMEYNGDRTKFLNNLKESGLTIRAFRDMKKRQVTVQSMRASKYDQDIPPSPDEINAEYRATKSQFRDMSLDKIVFEKIFIPARSDDPSKSPEDQLSFAEELVKELKADPKRFGELAKEYSKDMQAENGGLWPEKLRGDFAPEFAALVFNSKVGAIMGPILDPNGFTIVRVIKKIEAAAPPLSKIRDQIDAQVRRQRSNERYQAWVDRLRQKAIIKTFI